MFKTLTYKRKNQLLIAGMIGTFLLVYVFAIKKTITAYTDYSSAKVKVELAENAPAIAAQLQKQLMQIDAKIGSTDTTKQKAGEPLLELVTNYCQDHQAVLREFPQTTATAQGDMIVETNRFVIEGNFATLINLVYILEQKNKLGKIASVKYALQKDFKSKEMLLTATVFLQNVKKGNHEK